MLDHADDDRRTAIAAGIGVLVVVLSFEVSALGDGARRWAALAAVALAVAVGRSLSVLRRTLDRPGLAPLPVGATLLAVTLCVPETGAVYFGSFAVGAVVLVEVGTRAQVDVVWYGVVAGLVGWVGLGGAAGRPSALVGALVAWWAVVVLAVVDRWVPLRTPRAALAVALTGAVTVAVMARTAGTADSGWAALAIAALLTGVSLGVAGVLARALRERRLADPAPPWPDPDPPG